MLNKIKNIKILKSKYFYLVLSSLIIIAIGATFAWWRWSSDINALVNGKVCAPEIAFVGGTTINGTDLLPVRTKEEGLSKDINVNLNNTCDNDTAVLNLNLLLEEFPIGLSDASFKWSLYQVTTEEVEGTPTETLTFINDGNFANKVQSDVISLATDLIVTANVSTYRLFIWIDALMDNPSAIGDNIFRFKLYGTGTGARPSVEKVELPSEYQQVEYIVGGILDNGDIAYISFNQYSTKNYKFIAMVSCGNGYIYGNTGVSNWRTSIYKTNSSWAGDLMSIDSIENNGWWQTITATRTKSGYASAASTYLMRGPTDGTHSATNIMFFGFKIYNGNTLKRNFVPCYRISDGEIGVYDTVSKAFFANAGSGSFLKGPNVN